jgi:hypothetical protein
MFSASAEPASPSDDGFRTALGRVREILGVCSRQFNCSLPPLPMIADLPQLKSFCEELLVDPQSSWGSLLPESLTSVQRMTLAHSLFLARKIIPVDTSAPALKKAANSYVSRMTMPDHAPPPQGFLAFCDEQIAALFPEGWDRQYVHRASGLLLSTSGCLEAARKIGGSRAVGGYTKESMGRLNDPCFLHSVRRVAMGLGTFSRRNTHVKVNAIKDGCKLRVVSSASAQQFALAPLHDLIYDQLSKSPWLLRGDAKVNQFKEFSYCEGEVFVSGDYEGATDNISNEVYRHVLESIQRVSKHVPSTVWDEAQARANSYMTVPGGREGLQRRGQLMGNFLSFPVLCLVNYLTFKWAVGRDVPCRINGDDIVFRCRRDEAEKWFSAVGASGLIVSKGKTLVDERFFSLNSTMFRAYPTGRPRMVPFIRAKCLFNKAETLQALQGVYRAVAPGFTGAPRRLLQVILLRNNRSLISMGQRSLLRGLGMRVCSSVLRRVGLSRRERFYLTLESEPPVPLPVDGRAVKYDPVVGYTAVAVGDIPARERWKARLHDKSYHHAARLFAQLPPAQIAPSEIPALVPRYEGEGAQIPPPRDLLEGKLHECTDWCQCGDGSRPKASPFVAASASEEYKSRCQRGTEVYWEPRPNIRKLWSAHGGPTLWCDGGDPILRWVHPPLRPKLHVPSVTPEEEDLTIPLREVPVRFVTGPKDPGGGLAGALRPTRREGRRGLGWEEVRWAVVDP